MITEEEISHQNNNIFDLSHPIRQVEPKFPGTRRWGHQVVREGERRGHMLHVTCHPSQTWDMSYCLPVFRGVKQLLLCCCHYVSIIYSLKLYCFRLVPLIYDVMMWALNMQDWLYFFWAYWASWVWAGHEDTDTWHEDTNLCRTCDILTRSLVKIIKLLLLIFQKKFTKPYIILAFNFHDICPMWNQN